MLNARIIIQAAVAVAAVARLFASIQANKRRPAPPALKLVAKRGRK